MDRLSEFSFKAGGVEATAKTKQIEVAAALGAAYGKIPSGGQSTKPIKAISRKIAEIVEEKITEKNIKRLDKTQILWVDDRPENNVYERRALEALGIRFATSKSTDDALQMLEKGVYDVVISDMNRPPDDLAGYTLLKEMRQRGDTTPFIIYAGSNAPHYKAEAKKQGAQGFTNDPHELFTIVLSSIGTGK